MKKLKDVSFNKSRRISVFIGILIFLLTTSILSIKLKYSFYASLPIGIIVGEVMYSMIFSIFDGPIKNVYRKRLRISVVYQNLATEVKCKSIELNPYATRYNSFGNCRFYAILLTDNKVWISIDAQKENGDFIPRAYEIVDLSRFYQFFEFI